MRLLILLATALAAAADASAVQIFTQSFDFFSALPPSTGRIEDFSTAMNGQVIADGETRNGIAYAPFNLTGGATALDITNLYGSIAGLSLGADHTAADGAGATYFYGGEGARITFATPVYAVGVFFNVNPSGFFSVVTSEGSVVNDASFLESSMRSDSLVFAGLISDHAFDTVTFFSTGEDAVYNVAEIISDDCTPEPSTMLLALGGALLLVWKKRAARWTVSRDRSDPS